jgi:molecular chaperone GrpE
MPEPTLPPVAGGPADHGAPALTPAGIEAILADFRAWLTDLAAGTVPEQPAAPAEPVDLHALVGQFTALRHEVNLQTRAARAQQEQNAEALRRLGEAVDAFQEAPDEAEDDRPPPALLKALIDVADALTLARQEVERLARSAGPLLDQLRSLPAAPKADVRSLWERWLGGQRPVDVDPQQAREAAERARQLLDSVVGGYRMSLQRLERALEQQGLSPIDCAGLTFDPERMEAIEAVADSGRRPGEVLTVVRPGYEWNGKVFRYALVRVAKAADPVEQVADLPRNGAG